MINLIEITHSGIHNSLNNNYVINRTGIINITKKTLIVKQFIHRLENNFSALAVDRYRSTVQ